MHVRLGDAAEYLFYYMPFSKNLGTTIKHIKRRLEFFIYVSCLSTYIFLKIENYLHRYMTLNLIGSKFFIYIHDDFYQKYSISRFILVKIPKSPSFGTNLTDTYYLYSGTSDPGGQLPTQYLRESPLGGKKFVNKFFFVP